jgi:hypothetical protein
LEVKVYVQQVSLYRARQGIILPWFPTFVTGTWLSPRATNLASNGEVRNGRRLAADCSIRRVCFALVLFVYAADVDVKAKTRHY